MKMRNPEPTSIPVGTDLMYWYRSWRFDPRALPLADRHYNRQKVGSPQFAPPGRCLVLLSHNADALWITSWPKYSQHEWEGAWVCSCFRKEGLPWVKASQLITEAVAATRANWGEPPPLGMITFIDRDKIRPKRDPGRCYIKAGWRVCGETKKRKRLVLQLLPEQMPPAKVALESQRRRDNVQSHKRVVEA